MVGIAGETTAMCGSGSPQRQRLACSKCTSRCLQVHGRSTGDEETDSFFKIMLRSFRTTLFIPPKFGRNIETLEDRKAFLQDSEGNLWSVKVRRIRNSLAFHDGWHEFVKDHNIDVGEFVVFDHIGGSNFLVRIFGTSGCIRLHFTGQNASHSLKRKTRGTESSFDLLHSHEGIGTIGPSERERAVVHEASTSIKKPAATPVALTNTSDSVVTPRKSSPHSHKLQKLERTPLPKHIDAGGGALAKTGTSTTRSVGDATRGIGDSMNKNSFQPDRTAHLSDPGISVTSNGLNEESNEKQAMMIHESDETEEVPRKGRQEIICSPDVLHDSENNIGSNLAKSKVNPSKHSLNATEFLPMNQPSVGLRPEKPDNIVDEDSRKKKKQKTAIDDYIAQGVGETKQTAELSRRSVQDPAGVVETRSLYSVEASTGTKEEGGAPVSAICACTNRELLHGSDQRDECGESEKNIHVGPISGYSEVASNKRDMEKVDAPKSQGTESNGEIVPYRCKHEEKESCFFSVGLEPGPASVITENEMENPTSLRDFRRILVMEDGRCIVDRESDDDKSYSETIAPLKMDNSEIDIDSCKVNCSFFTDSTASNHMTCSEKSCNTQEPAQKLEDLDPGDGNFPKVHMQGKDGSHVDNGPYHISSVLECHSSPHSAGAGSYHLERKARVEHGINETELVPVKIERTPPCDAVKYSFSITMNVQPWLGLSEALPSIRKRNERKVVLLRDSLMRSWPVLYHESEKFVGFLGGWQAFASANNLQEGDVCMLEMVNECDSTFSAVISGK